MSVTVMSKVYEARFGNVITKAVALKMADRANDEGGSTFESVGNIAKAVEVSERSVQRAIGLMLQKGVLHLVKAGGRGKKSTNHYAFDLARLRLLSGGEVTLLQLPDAPPDKKVVTVTTLAEPLRWSPSADRVTPSPRKGDTVSPNTSGTIRNHQCSRARAHDTATPGEAWDDHERSGATVPMVGEGSAGAGQGRPPAHQVPGRFAWFLAWIGSARRWRPGGRAP